MILSKAQVLEVYSNNELKEILGKYLTVKLNIDDCRNQSPKMCLKETHLLVFTATEELRLHCAHCTRVSLCGSHSMPPLKLGCKAACTLMCARLSQIISSE